MSIHSSAALSRYNKVAADALRAAALSSNLAPVFGLGNSKTGHVITEGTLPGRAVGTCHQCADCEGECYAIWHMAALYPACLRKYCVNTLSRRDDAELYYARLFTFAFENTRVGAYPFIRVNETGDFESWAQLLALFEVARNYPSVRVLGYTRNPDLLDFLAGAPKNVRILFSTYRHGDPDGEIIRKAPITVVSESESTCPSQIAAQNGKKWYCHNCAACGCGCFGRDCVVFRAH